MEFDIQFFAYNAEEEKNKAQQESDAYWDTVTRENSAINRTERDTAKQMADIDYFSQSRNLDLQKAMELEKAQDVFGSSGLGGGGGELQSMQGIEAKNAMEATKLQALKNQAWQDAEFAFQQAETELFNMTEAGRINDRNAINNAYFNYLMWEEDNKTQKEAYDKM